MSKILPYLEYFKNEELRGDLLTSLAQEIHVKVTVFLLKMSPFRNVLLVGASGRAGSAIQAELLAKKKNFSKLGVLTASSSAPNPKKDAYWESLEAQGVQITRVDFSDSGALVEAFRGKHSPFSLQIKCTC